MRGSEFGGGDEGLQSVFGADNAVVIERKIEQLGYGVPQLDSDLHRLQREIS